MLATPSHEDVGLQKDPVVVRKFAGWPVPSYSNVCLQPSHYLTPAVRDITTMVIKDLVA